MRELPFVVPERRCVVVPAAVMVNRWVLDVEHFVVDDVLHDPTRHIPGVERLTYDDRLMRRVVMCEDAVRLLRRPRQYRFWKLPAKIPEIQVLEDLVEIVNFAFVGRDDLSPVRTLSIVRAFAHLGAIDVFRINLIGLTGHALP